MSLTPTLNQFRLSPVKGTLTGAPNFNIINCQVSDGETTDLVPGQAVKLKDDVNAQIIVTAATGASDDIFGFVAYDVRDTNKPEKGQVRIAIEGSVMYLEAQSVIARGAYLKYNPTGQIVEGQDGTTTRIGRTFDKTTTTDPKLIRVYIQTPKSAALVV
jgi:hypothetical protein